MTASYCTCDNKRGTDALHRGEWRGRKKGRRKRRRRRSRKKKEEVGEKVHKGRVSGGREGYPHGS